MTDDEGYRAMAADKTREAEALEWCNALAEDMAAEDDAMWLQRAQDAAAGGYLSADETEEFMKKRLARVQAD